MSELESSKQIHIDTKGMKIICRNKATISNLTESVPQKKNHSPSQTTTARSVAYRMGIRVDGDIKWGSIYEGVVTYGSRSDSLGEVVEIHIDGSVYHGRSSLGIFWKNNSRDHCLEITKLCI
jgi:hypothetical protein